MTRKYKTNWQGKRTSTRFPVTFDAQKIASEVKEACTICGGKIEECPMMRGVCYSCYRDIIGKEEHKALKIVLDVTTVPDCPLCGDTGRGVPTLQEPDGADNGCICTRDDWQIEAEAQAVDANDWGMQTNELRNG